MTQFVCSENQTNRLDEFVEQILKCFHTQNKKKAVGRNGQSKCIFIESTKWYYVKFCLENVTRKKKLLKRQTECIIYFAILNDTMF